MGLTYREEKGSPLTFEEMDNNFRYFTGSQDIVAVTSSLSTNNLIGGDSQGGRTILIDNGSNNVNIVCDGNIRANYQRLGTGTVTFVAGSGRTLASPQGLSLTSQYEGASLTFSGSTDILTKGGSLFFLMGMILKLSLGIMNWQNILLII